MGRLVVIGAAGQLAQALLAAAADRDVIALGRDRIDLSAPSTVAEALAALQPDAVINAAAYTAVDRAETDEAAAYAVNAAGPAALAQACAALEAALVHVSTDFVFDGAKGEPYTENDPRNPLNAYGRTKAAGEDAVLASGARAAIVRTSWVFSAFGANFVNTMLNLAASGREEIGVVADQMGRPTYAPDLAQACLATTDALLEGRDEAHGLVHFCGAGDASWADVAEAVFEEARRRGLPSARVRRIATAEYPTAARRPADSRLDVTRMRETLGLNPTPWRAALARCMDQLAASR